MSERIYYVLCRDNCRFESMTKEQIIAAIAEATGNTPTSVDDAFITKIKEINANAQLKFWVGTTAQYNAIATPADDVFYLLTDDTFGDSVQADIEELQTDIAGIDISITTLNSEMGEIYNPAKTLKITDYASDDYITVRSVDGTVYTDEDVQGGLYMVRVDIDGGTTKASLMFDFSGSDAVYSSVFMDASRTSTYVIKAVPNNDGTHKLKLMSAASDTEYTQYDIAVRKIGSAYAVG